MASWVWIQDSKVYTKLSVLDLKQKLKLVALHFVYLVHMQCKQVMRLVSPCRANLVIQCESWWNLAKQFASRSPPLNFLSSPVQRTLMKALVLGGFAHMDAETKQQYWTEVTIPLPLTAFPHRPAGVSSMCCRRQSVET